MISAKAVKKKFHRIPMEKLPAPRTSSPRTRRSLMINQIPNDKVEKDPSKVATYMFKYSTIIKIPLFRHLATN